MMSKELQVIAKRLETRHIDALFDILLVNTHLPPLPLSMLLGI